MTGNSFKNDIQLQNPSYKTLYTSCNVSQGKAGWLTLTAKTLTKLYRALMCDIIRFSFLHFSIFMTIFQQNMMKNPHTPNLTWIGSLWPEIWSHEPGQSTLISMGLIRYSCGHISCPHELIPTRFGLWMFLSCSIDTWYPKFWMQKKSFFVMSSLLLENISKKDTGSDSAMALVYTHGKAYLLKQKL